MIERLQTYFQTLERLSTEELDRSVTKLVRVEKTNVALVIAHIAEISRRKGALERGYENLFDYCVRRLQLSEGSVAMRIQVANVVRRFPQLLVALSENRVSLTVAGLLAPHLTADNVDRLITECSGMAKVSPLATSPPRFRNACTRAPATNANSWGRMGLGVASERGSRSSTKGHLPCIRATTRIFSRCTAARTIV